MRRSQSFFAFKQFTIHQDKCGMKVSTDACIQAAWAPLPENVKQILDVGTGTGVLSLMLAQRAVQVKIDSIEIDEFAAKQATENVAASPFADRITVHCVDAKTFKAPNNYDLLICNPPFFSNDLASNDAVRNHARHDEMLTAEDLISLAGRALREDGSLCVMWPERRKEEWQQLMGNARFSLRHELVVRNRIGARASSVISVWSKISRPTSLSETLYIRDSSGFYTSDFTSLMKDFYVRL